MTCCLWVGNLLTVPGDCGFTGGAEAINFSHFIGAVYGMENMMGLSSIDSCINFTLVLVMLVRNIFKLKCRPSTRNPETKELSTSIYIYIFTYV